jgi:hypothetical protein
MTKRSIVQCLARAVAGLAVGSFLGSSNASADVNVGSSQWVWQNPLPQTNALRAITCFLSGTVLTCQAVGDLGTILYGDASGSAAAR